MVKEHTIKLNIKNETPLMMTYDTQWFDSGRVADHFEWPKRIKPTETHTIVCYERDWSMAGCSGYVQYLVNGSTITIAFSNPSVGSNKLGVGMGNGYLVWDGISSHDYQPFKEFVECGDVKVTAYCACTGGTTNSASVKFFCNLPPYPGSGCQYSSEKC